MCTIRGNIILYIIIIYISVIFSWYNINMFHYEIIVVYIVPLEWLLARKTQNFPAQKPNIIHNGYYVRKFRRNFLEWNLRICMVISIYHPFLSNYILCFHVMFFLSSVSPHFYIMFRKKIIRMVLGGSKLF